MNEPQESSMGLGTLLLTFLAGAAAGAVVVALTTPKTRREYRHELRKLSRRAKRKVGDLSDDGVDVWDNLKARVGLAADEAEAQVEEAMNSRKL